MKDHRRFRMLAATRIDFPLVEAEAAELERHLATCCPCRMVADELGKDHAALVGLASPILAAPSPAFAAGAMAPRPVRVRATNVPRLSSLLAAAAVVLAIAFGASVIGTRFRTVASPPSTAPSPVPSPSVTPTAVASETTVTRIGTTVAIVDAGVQPVAEPQFCPYTGSWDCVVSIVGGAGAVWTTYGPSVARIDPATNAISAVIDVGSDPRRIVFDGGFVWVTVAAGDLVQIDPATNTVRRRIPVGAEPAGLATDGHDLWVVLPASNRVVRVNPADARIVASIDLPGQPWGIALDATSAWLAFGGGGSSSTGAGGVARIDTGTNRIVGTTPVADAREVVVASGSVWVAGHDQVTRLDAATGKVVSSQFVGAWPNLAAVGGSIWIASAINGDVRRWNVDTDQIDGVFAVGTGNGSYETALAVVDGDVWLRTHSRQIDRIRPIGP